MSDAQWNSFPLQRKVAPYNPNSNPVPSFMDTAQINPAPVTPLTDREFANLVGANNTTPPTGSFMNTGFGNTGGVTDGMVNSDLYNTTASGLTPQTGSSAAPAGSGGWLTDWFGGQYGDGSSTTGIVSPMAGIATNAMNAYLGMQKLKLAKESLNFQKDAFSKQFENQRTLTNAQLRDRQIARDSATGRSTVGSYMKQNGV